jgi:hypothetical protein
MPKDARRTDLSDPILEKMKRGVYYPGHHLGAREDLDRLVAEGLLERLDGSFLCGPDSEPAYCLAEPKRSKPRPTTPHETRR